MGYPDWFEVTNLEIVAAAGATGNPMQDVIEIGASAAPARNAFRMIVTFEGPNVFVGPDWPWLGLAEASSDATPAIPATAQFWAESIGPGHAEVLIGTGTVDLTAGGDPGGHPSTGYSLYLAQFDVASADAVFVDAGVLQPGVYRLACAVQIEYEIAPTIFVYADAYFLGDLVVRVVERS